MVQRRMPHIGEDRAEAPYRSDQLIIPTPDLTIDHSTHHEAPLR